VSLHRLESPFMRALAVGLASVAALTCLFANADLLAQRGAAPTRRGWIWRNTSMQGISGTERATVEARLREIEKVLQRVPLLANPNGFVVNSFLFGDQSSNGELIQSRYEIGLAPAAGLDAQASIEVVVNPRLPFIHAYNQWGALPEEGGDTIFFEERFGDPRPDATHVYGKLEPQGGSYLVLMTTGRVSPLLPVTREEYLKAVILALEGPPGRRTPYQQWLDGAADRKKSLEETITLLPAAQRDAFRKGMEDEERKTTEQFKAADSQPTASDPVRAKLASLTLAERRSQVWVKGKTDYAEFAAPNTPNAVHAVRANPAFYRPLRSRTEARGIHVRFSTGSNPQMRAAVMQAAAMLDWSALATLLEPAR